MDVGAALTPVQTALLFLFLAMHLLVQHMKIG